MPPNTQEATPGIGSSQVALYDPAYGDTHLQKQARKPVGGHCKVVGLIIWGGRGTSWAADNNALAHSCLTHVAIHVTPDELSLLQPELEKLPTCGWG